MEIQRRFIVEVSVDEFKVDECRFHTLANVTAILLQIKSQCSLSAVSVESPWCLRGAFVVSQSVANPLLMRRELISTNEEKKNVNLHDKKAGKIKEKKFIKKVYVSLLLLMKI